MTAAARAASTAPTDSEAACGSDSPANGNERAGRGVAPRLQRAGLLINLDGLSLAGREEEVGRVLARMLVRQALRELGENLAESM